MYKWYILEVLVQFRKLDWKINCDFQIIRKWITDIVRRFRKTFRIPAILPANHHLWRHNHHLRWPNSFLNLYFIFLYTSFDLLYFLFLFNYLFSIYNYNNYFYFCWHFILLTSWLLTFYFIWLFIVDCCWLAIFAGFHRHWVCVFCNLLISPATIPEAFSSANPSTLQRTLSILLPNSSCTLSLCHQPTWLSLPCY